MSKLPLLVGLVGSVLVGCASEPESDPVRAEDPATSTSAPPPLTLAARTTDTYVMASDPSSDPGTDSGFTIQSRSAEGFVFYAKR